MTGPITITYHQAIQAGACGESLDRMRASDHVGGDWGAYGRDKPIPLTAVFDALGLDDTLWALSAVGEDKLLRLFASDCAARAHRYFHRVSPDDGRPAEAIRVARLRAHGLAGAADWAAAGAAANAAASAADWAAARAAASAADWAAASAADWAAAGAADWAAAGAAAGAADWAAASAADWAAAGAAASAADWAAARAAARAWQTQHLHSILTGDTIPGRLDPTRWEVEA